ncbi:DUF1190 domain-containing protein [Roseomonas elaeocarpi]|uniref:DUF1190 domain-containing protein n=1 Tax=Roseomonas elaeocarpi TaxID=907779 RepID=A0ABV6JWD7_9PROT
MRRSTTITLTLLAGAGLGLAYCNRDPDTEGVLETQAACVDRLGDEAASECAEVFRSARLSHAATAPRFSSAEACRAATGSDCAPLGAEPSQADDVPGASPWTAPGASPGAATAASTFIPVMAGVMIGRALSDGTRGATPVYAGAAPPACPPGTQGGAGCTASSSGSGGAGGGGRRYWYSGNSYAGSSDGEARGGFRRAATSAEGEGLLSRGARTGSSYARAGGSVSRAGGLGFSAAAHAGGGS